MSTFFAQRQNTKKNTYLFLLKTLKKKKHIFDTYTPRSNQINFDPYFWCIIRKLRFKIICIKEIIVDTYQVLCIQYCNIYNIYPDTARYPDTVLTVLISTIRYSCTRRTSLRPSLERSSYRHHLPADSPHPHSTVRSNSRTTNPAKQTRTQTAHSVQRYE